MKKLFFYTVVASTLLTTLIAVSAQRRSPQTKIATAVTKALIAEPATDILVVLKEQADLSPASALTTKEAKGRFVYDTLRTIALRSQKNLLTFLGTTGLEIHPFYIGNMIAVQSAPAALIKEIAARSDVAKIIASPLIPQKKPIRIPEIRSLLPDTVEASLRRIGATTVWEKYRVRGEGIVVAGQDTGVEWTHPALRAQYRGYTNGTVNHAYNWHDAIVKPLRTENPEEKKSRCGYDSAEPCDDSAHGTHTVGTMVGSDGGANQIGVAPGAKWIACRNMDAGTGTPVTYIDCFQWFLAPYAQGENAFTDGKPELAPHVMNNSWGCPEEEGCAGQEMEPVMEALYRAGIFVVASAGNEGPGCSTIAAQPASLSNLTFSVGALNPNDSIASFSSRGPSALTGQIGPDISAPGVNIRSAIPGGGYEGGWSGTSMSGPHVAGAVALLWSAQPKLIGQIKETADILRTTAHHLTTNEHCGGVSGLEIPNNTFGYGALDIAAAVEKALAL